MSDTQTVEVLTATLGELSDADLATLRAKEVVGENRVTALAAIDAEAKRRADEKAKGDGGDGDGDAALEEKLKSDADAASQAAADAKAQAAGFVDAQAQADAEKRVTKKAKPAAVRASKVAAIDHENGLAQARALIQAGEGDVLRVGFGDASKPFDAIPFATAEMRAVGLRLVTGVDIIMRTAKLSGTVTVSHAWLIGKSDAVMAGAELGAPMVVVPGQQIKIVAGRLAFA